VEEATSASQSMKQQAAELLKQVAFFKFEAEGQGFSAQAGLSQGVGKGMAQAHAKKSSSVTKPMQPAKIQSSPKAVAKPQPVGVGSSNGQERRQREDDFFEEF
ncbi:MAG: hypothetical protein KC563_14590, partial [Nitrospira sp.]|nr:hypothetical protein [Nitrospira sp.]